MNRLLTFFILCSFGLINAQDAKKYNVDSNSLAKVMRSTLHELSIPGIALIIFQSEGPLFAKAIGLKNINRPDSLRLTDKMHLGSCTKAFTGYLAGILVRRGIIKWESKIIDIFPEFKTVIRKEYQQMTLADLLSHHAGVQPFVNSEVWIHMHNSKQFKGKNIVENRYKFTKWVLQKEPVKPDSTKGKEDFVYSNAGYVVATAMLEKVTGQAWDQLLEKLVFKPLHINAIIGWPATKDINQPWGHWWNGDSTKLIPVSPKGEWFLPDLVEPAGDISMSILDYGKWLQKNLKGLKGEKSEFDKSFYDYLHYANIEKSYYSMGWASYKDSTFTISTHSGSARTFYCHVIVVKELDLAMAVFSNGGTDEIKEGMKRLINGVLKL